jgi:hypothetical protein
MTLKSMDENSQATLSGPKVVATGVPAADRRVVASERFPRVLGPYSHAVVAGGLQLWMTSTE